jgi:tetratricopeptide (TPR) repeat protein
LSNIYNWHIPNTEKYLVHALQGIQLAVMGQDSVTASYTYLHLSNAFAQAGFLNEAEKYAKKSLAYNPDNLYAEYLNVYIQSGRDFDLVKARASLLGIFQKDTTRIDLMQEIAKVSYTMGDYEQAWIYYNKMITTEKALHLDIYRGEYLNVGFVLRQLGRNVEADEYYARYFEYANEVESIYNDLMFAAYYSVKGDTDQAIQYLKDFSEEENYHLWLVMFLDKDPILLKMSGHPDFKKTVKKIKDKFWSRHREIKKMLEEKEVI